MLGRMHVKRGGIWSSVYGATATVVSTSMETWEVGLMSEGMVKDAREDNREWTPINMIPNRSYTGFQLR